MILPHLSFCIVLILLIGLSCKDKKSHATHDMILHGNSEIPNKEARAIFEKGLGFVEKGDYGNARQYFFEADHECPNTPIILNAIGNSFSQTGNPERGNTYFERSLKIDSSFVASYVNLGASLNMMAQFENAKQIFRLGLAKPSVDSLNRSSLFLNLANSYFLGKDYDRASLFLDSVKANSRHGRLFDLATQAQREINIKMPQPAIRR